MLRYLAPLILVALAGLAIVGLREDRAPVATAESSIAEPRYVLRGAQWRSFDAQGALRFEGRASSIDYFDDESAQMRDFDVRVLGQGGTPWTAAAPEAFAPPGSRDRMQLRGGVEGHGRWPDGEALTFRTPELWVDSQAETLQTDAPVEVESPSRRGSAVGLAVSGPDQRMALLKNVEMRYAPPR